jgi:hypothetical protein
MTKEEAICIVEEIRDDIYNYGTAHDNLSFADEDKIESLNMAIAMFKAEPCEDAISRQAVLDALQPYIDANKDNEDLYLSGCGDGAYHALHTIKTLPSVQPKPKTGHWVKKSQYGNDYCSECDYELLMCGKPKFCPNCGADMRGTE